MNTTKKGTPMAGNPAAACARLHLERLRLATDVLLSEPDDIPDSLEAELTLLRDGIERALLSMEALLLMEALLSMEAGLPEMPRSGPGSFP
ncbi:MAG TPA: hypothetical protein VMG38_10615 [Trebonia sp.]|nr:hypothetical protein [Trebonia sp.]